MAKAFNSISTELDSMDRVTFGKHAGNTWLWVAENFPDYIIWCVGNTDQKFSKQLIVSAIKSKYKKKKEAASQEQDLDNEANAWKFPNRVALPSNKPAYFYDGGLRGDMAHFAATQEQEANGSLYAESWDDDVPF